jgi:hypothetical protein
MTRYFVEQVGSEDWAVWDDKGETWAVDCGGRDHCEKTAAHLNRKADEESARGGLTIRQLQLLRELAEHDKGDGVLFTREPRARFANPHTGSKFNGRTFWHLVVPQLIDVGDSDSDPVRMTGAGRAFLKDLDARNT